jgi:hypothetical protein
VARRLFGDSGRSHGYRRGTGTVYGGPGRDLIDYACLENRGNDVAYADSEDTVVDCKDVYGDPRTIRVRMPE